MYTPEKLAKEILDGVRKYAKKNKLNKEFYEVVLTFDEVKDRMGKKRLHGSLKTKIIKELKKLDVEVEIVCDTFELMIVRKCLLSNKNILTGKQIFNQGA
jgi:hypothetical protein